MTQRYAELNRLNHFELLGIPETADREALSKAFRQNMRSFHPDRLSRGEESLRPLAAEILCRVTEAHRVLEDRTSREQYAAGLPASGASLAPARQVAFDPDRLFQAAVICLKRRRVDDAILLVRQACAAKPDDLQYLALHAWLRAERGELHSGAAETILGILNRAVRERSTDLEIRMYRARVLQRLGRSEEAYRDFSFVAKADRMNMDAALEVRLHERRKSETESPPVSGTYSRSRQR